MLALIPPDTPAALFLLGHDLVLLQSFTQDPALLRAAAKKVMDTKLDNGGIGVAPQDDPGSLTNLIGDMFGSATDETLSNNSSSVTSSPGSGSPVVAGQPTGPPGSPTG